MSNSSSTTASTDDSPPPPPPPPIDLRTTGQLLKQATFSFFSLFLTFFFLSLLLFSFRTLVENGAAYVTSFIDRDPSLKSLLSRLDIAGKNLHSSDSSLPGHHFATARHHHHHHHRRRPFLHLTRVGTLDEDFFSGDDDDDRSIFGNHRKAKVNGSFLALSSFDSKLGFSKFVVDNGIRFSEVVRTGTSFKLGGLRTENAEVNDEKNSTVRESEEERENVDEGMVDLRFFVAGLELGRRDAAALFFLVGVLSAAYGWVILGFVITYSWVLGIAFVAVVNDLLGRDSSFAETVWSGSRLGLKRLSGFILMRWAVRDALTQFLGLWFFGEIEDQYSFFKLFLRLKLMPFSITSPWIGGYQKEISGFLFAWFLMDTLVAFMLAVDSWVTIVNTRRSGREIVKEGCNLLATKFHQAVQLKCLEVILSGPFVRWVIAQFCGRSIAIIFQSMAEVYFMVAWLIFYFSARCRDASLSGRSFGRRELEGIIEGLR
ncbi:hypothetical protein Ancab_014591 [Ancistrocladus abbreviatus]